MNPMRAIEIGTCGACGLVARAVLVRLGGVPHLRYESGAAVHAAVKVDGRFIHLGSDDGLEPVEMDEFIRAVREDLDSGRVNLRGGELRQVVEMICK